MEKIKNALKNNLLLILAIVSGVLILGGIVICILGIAKASTAFYTVMLIIISIVMILLGCVLIQYINLVAGQNVSKNLFLYDTAENKNLDVEELDFDRINKRMGSFMGNISSGIRELWSENLFIGHDDIWGGTEELKTLLAYKMLYDLSVVNKEALWGLYLAADGELIEAMADAISNNDGDELGMYIMKLQAGAEGSFEKSKKFLDDNKNYIENKMFNFTKSNIEKFYL